MSVMAKILQILTPGMKLKTPDLYKAALFRVTTVSKEGVGLSVGTRDSELFIPTALLEGTTDFLKEKGWAEIGANHDKAKPGTLEDYLDQSRRELRIPRQSNGSYIAPILKQAGFVEIDGRRPNRIRLRRAEGTP